MGLTALNILWLVPAFALATQDIVTLSVSPQVTAECDEEVTFQCSVSSRSPENLQIKHLGWSHNKTLLCSVNSEGDVKNHTGRFLCGYKHQQLSLTLPKVQPVERGQYRCKLQSNQGTSHQYTQLDLQECRVTAEGSLTSQGPNCTFKHVWPDGDVHWFHGPHRLSGGSVKHNTTKQVKEGGWLTIESRLEGLSSDKPYNCSLKSTKSGRYIASALVEHTPASVKSVIRNVPSSSHRNGVTAVTTVLSFSVLLSFTLN